MCLLAVTHWPNSDSSQCQIGVIGLSDGTLVNITFPALWPGRAGLQVEYDGHTYTNGETLSVVMDRFSTLQLQNRGTYLVDVHVHTARM